MASVIDRLHELTPLPLATQCAWCGAVLIRGEWRGEMGHDIVQRVTILGVEHKVSHGICPTCVPLVTAGEPTPNLPVTPSAS